MHMPGFVADAALSRRPFRYSGAFDAAIDRDLVVAMGGVGIAPVPPPPPPILPFPPDIPPNPLPPNWPVWPPYQPIGPDLPKPPVRPLPWQILVAIGEALVAVGAGVAIGAGVGLGLEYGLTPDEPAPGATTPTCRTIGPQTLRNIQMSWWGCERSLIKTIETANGICAKLPNHCSTAPCASGAPCTARATITGGPIQTPGWTSCETYFWYTCDCGC